MVGGLELLIDGETVVFRSLHVLLSLLGPCKLDNSFLKRDVVAVPKRILIGLAYENHSCRLIVTVAGQSKRLRKKKLTSFSTIIVSRLLCGIGALIRPTRNLHIFFSFVVRLVLFTLLTASNFLLLSFWSILSLSGLLRLSPIVWPNFAIDMQSEDGRCLLQLLFQVKKTSCLLIPSLKVEKDYWILNGNSSLYLDFSVKSDLFQATGSDVKLILNSTSLVIPSMAQILDAAVSLLPNNENYCVREERFKLQGKNAFKLNCYLAIEGNVLDLQVMETSFNASYYLKLKALTENYHNDIGCGQKQKDVHDNPNDVHNILSIKFEEICVHGVSSKYPLLLACKPSFSFHSLHCSPLDCSADCDEADTWRDSDAGDERKKSFDYNCEELKLFLNSDSENKIILTGISSYYSCASRTEEGKETANHVLRCQKVDVEIFEEFLDLALKKETTILIKHLCYLANMAVGKSSHCCVCSFLVQEFGLHLFHRTVNKPFVKSRRRGLSKLTGIKRNRDDGGSVSIDGCESDRERSTTTTTAAAAATAATCCTVHHNIKNDIKNGFNESSDVLTIRSYSTPLQCVSNISFTDLNVFSNEKSTKFTAKKIVQNFGKFFTTNRYI